MVKNITEEAKRDKTDDQYNMLTRTLFPSFGEAAVQPWTNASVIPLIPIKGRYKPRYLDNNITKSTPFDDSDDLRKIMFNIVKFPFEKSAKVGNRHEIHNIRFVSFSRSLKQTVVDTDDPNRTLAASSIGLKSNLAGIEARFEALE